jgi:hypothetical protein
MSEQGYEQLTLFPVDSLVSHSVSPDYKRENQMADTYGPKCSGLSANLRRVGLLLKTYLESCELPETMFVRRYTILATRSGFSVMKLRLSARRTDERAYFLWATPCAADCQGAWVGGRAKSLRTDVKMFPTPTSQKLTSNCANPDDLIDSHGNPWEPGKKPHDRRTALHDFVRHMWPTPTVNGNHNRKVASETSGDGLATAVKMWPTPTTPRPHDSENTAGKFMPGQKQKDLTSVVARTGGQLNPTWVEWLMGFPIGWTDLNASETR